jgi:hypothetical protein
MPRVTPPIWIDEHGKEVPTLLCPRPTCGGEWPVYRHRLQHLIMAGWKPGQSLIRVGWCGHSQQFTPWPEEDGYWRLVPLVDVVAR